MITVNKEEKRIDIVNENYPKVLVLVDGTGLEVPLTDGTGCLTNIQSLMNEVKAYGLTELETV
jgi:hypothetical protein